MRSGPGQNYPVRTVYERKNLPIEIIREYQGWRQIRDHEGDIGWVYKSLLSGARYVINQNDKKYTNIYKKNNAESRKIALAESESLLRLESCASVWCEVSAQGYEGWIERKFLWGIYADEIIK